jgi:hypothetical protein
VDIIFRKRVNKKILVVIGIVSVIISVVFGTFYLSTVEKNSADWDSVREHISQLEEEEIQSMLVEWNYRDILRNPEYYDNKPIKVSGTITETFDGHYDFTVDGNDLQYYDENFFYIIHSNQKWLIGDEIEIIGAVSILEDSSNLRFGELVPVLVPLKTTCLNC